MCKNWLRRVKLTPSLVKSQVSFPSRMQAAMADERTRIPGRELGRWLFVAAILIIGIALYFNYAPRAEPVVRATVQDAAP